MVCGCGSKGLHAPLPKPARRLVVRLPWRDGATIPRRYTCDGPGAPPGVHATRVPHERDQAIVMTDPDAPGGTVVHWTACGAGEGRNSLGNTGYGAPCPPPAAVLAAIRPDSLASGSETGVYGR